jgi:hypothetical protein
MVQSTYADMSIRLTPFREPSSVLGVCKTSLKEKPYSARAQATDRGKACHTFTGGVGELDGKACRQIRPGLATHAGERQRVDVRGSRHAAIIRPSDGRALVVDQRLHRGGRTLHHKKINTLRMGKIRRDT